MGFLNRILKKNDNVFIAYDENDEDVAMEVCEVLEYNGLSCWLKSRDLGVMDKATEIMNAINNAGLCVVIYSEHSKDSNFVNNEVDTAFSNRIPLIVFKIDDIRLKGGFEFFLASSPCIDAYVNYKNGLNELISKSLGALGKSDKNIKLPKQFTNQSSHDVFLSYSAEDAEIANLLLENLESNGFKCWIAPRDIKSGISYMADIGDAIKNAKLFLSVFTENYQESKTAVNELDLAFSAAKPIVSLKADDSFPEGRCEYFLKMAQWVDGSILDLEMAVAEIIREVSKIVRGKEISPVVNIHSKSESKSEPKTEKRGSHDVFISYSSKDAIVAEEICAKLEDDGYKCWIAQRDLKIARRYADEIDDAIRASKLFIPVFSRNFQESRYTNNELGRAFSEQKHILAFRINSYPEGNCEFYLKSSQWVDGEDNLNDGIESLVQYAGDILDEFTVKETQISLESDKDMCRIQNDSVKISGMLKDDAGNPLGSKPLKVNVDGNDVDIIESLDDGSYSASLDFNEVGIREIRVMFDGDKKYVSSDASIGIEVCKFDTDIMLSATSDAVAVGNVIALSGSLKAKNKPVARAGVDLYKGDDLIDTVVTSNAGRFSMLLPADKIETLKFKAVFEGNDVYGKCETSRVIVNVVEAIIHDLSSQQDTIKRPFKAYQGKEPYIFVSYAHKDAQLVFPEIKLFHDEGYPIWYDQGLTPGQEWDDEVASALINCSLLVVFLSDNSMASNNVQDEIKLALKRNIDIVPIYFEETELPPGLELRLSNKHAIMKFSWERDDYVSECFKAFDKANIPKIDFND